MKKAIVLVLALVLTLSLALPAAAAGSPGDPEKLPEKIETIVETEDGRRLRVIIIIDPKLWTEEQRDEILRDKVAVEKSLEDGEFIVMSAYIEVIDEDGNTVDDVELNLPLEFLKKLMTSIENDTFIQVVDGKAVELEYKTIDGEVFLKGVRRGPVFIV